MITRMIVCKFCRNKVEKLVKSHIIPKAFFEYSKAKSNALKNTSMLMFTNAKKQFPIRRSWVGWYDNNLVCSECESRFSPNDDYAIKLLLQEEAKHREVIINGDLRGWEIDRFDYKKLKLFFISLLWRAGASQLPQFKKIKLGLNLQKAKEIFESNMLDNENDFSFMLSRFSDSLGQSFILDPHHERKTDLWGDLDVYRFYLGAGYIVYIKTDMRPFPHPSVLFVVLDNSPLRISNKGEFKESKELDVLQKVGMDAKKRLTEISNNI